MTAATATQAIRNIVVSPPKAGSLAAACPTGYHRMSSNGSFGLVAVLAAAASVGAWCAMPPKPKVNRDAAAGTYTMPETVTS